MKKVDKLQDICWALGHYAQGGKDKAGAVYFNSVPGVTDPAPSVSHQGQPQPQQSLPEPSAQREPLPVSRTSTSDSYLPYPGSPEQPNGTTSNLSLPYVGSIDQGEGHISSLV